MADKLLPLKLPPGMRNTGTVYQSKDRWYTGNFVRFFQDTIQPIGGWTKRTLTGAAITGTVTAAIEWSMWYSTSNISYLAIGTTTGVFVVNTSTNVVTDITPALITAEGAVATRTWQFAIFGTWLIAVSGSTTPVYGTPGGGFVWVWKGDLTANLVRTSSSYDTGGGGLLDDPYDCNGVAATPERFIIALQGQDPGGTIRETAWVD